MDRRTVTQQLIDFLTKPQAHITLEGALKDLPEEMWGACATGMPYSVWQLVEHLRFAQRDIANFCRNTNGTGGEYVAPKWPDDYWVKQPAPPDDKSRKASLLAIKLDLDNFCDLLSDPQNDLLKPFSWGDGQNLMREALLIGDHSAYHVGEIVAVRRALGCWNK